LQELVFFFALVYLIVMKDTVTCEETRWPRPFKKKNLITL
jgi:hypothetical protein